VTDFSTLQVLDAVIDGEWTKRNSTFSLENIKMQARLDAQVRTSAVDAAYVQRGSEFLSDGVTKIPGGGHKLLSTKAVSPDAPKCFNKEKIGCVPIEGLSTTEAISLEVARGTGYLEMMKPSHPLDMMGHGTY